MEHAVANLFTLQSLLLYTVELRYHPWFILLRLSKLDRLKPSENSYIYLLDSELYFSNFLIPNLKRC